MFDASSGEGSDALAENLFRQGLLRYTAPWSLVGRPVVSVPCGFVEGLPVGLSLVGHRFDEATPLRAAAAFQQVTDWHESGARPNPAEPAQPGAGSQVPCSTWRRRHSSATSRCVPNQTSGKPLM